MCPLRMDSISPSLLGLQKVSAAGLHGHVLGAGRLGAGTPGWGTHCESQNPHAFGRISVIVMISHLWVTHLGLWNLTVLSLLPISLRFLLYILIFHP